ncbi:hypothetical protein O6P43_000747 [Quillaja saponaria]|uniref:Uncharacterized protein n=1 Tax=Quillaja saponaria TaxID=32244 RepID=A0AAD7VN49_QUISA|nr:hypothetical protein O6P43_000747 [Quillaja saponaria]
MFMVEHEGLHAYVYHFAAVVVKYYAACLSEATKNHVKLGAEEGEEGGTETGIAEGGRATEPEPEPEPKPTPPTQGCSKQSTGCSMMASHSFLLLCNGFSGKQFLRSSYTMPFDVKFWHIPSSSQKKL